MNAYRKSVGRPAPGAGAPKPKNSLVTVVYAEDIASFPISDENGVKTLGNIVLKTGAKMHTLYETDDSQKASHTIEGDADAEGFLKKFEGSHPGDSLEINEFVQNSIGQGMIVIYSAECGSEWKKVIGTPCNPLYLKGEFTDDKDAVKHTLNFEQRKRDRFVAKFYNGELIYQDNHVATTAALAINAANGVVYQLPPSDVADSEISFTEVALDNKKVISIIGSGGEEPSTLSNGVSGPVTVLLDTGLDWIAYKNAVINLQVFNAGGTKYLIELSRS